MLPHQRHQKILASLKEDESIRTIEIAKLLGVTDETVRKDFEALEKRGALVRVHGGATTQPRTRRDLPLNERQVINRASKTAIAKAAVDRLVEHDTIFMDASSTALTMAEFFPDFPITVVSNAHNVFEALAHKSNVDLICTGGIYDARSHSYIGLPAELALKRYSIQKMFFSGTGVLLNRGVSEANSRQANFKERVIELSQERIFLADHTKLGASAPFFFGDLVDITTLITDSAADQDFVAEAGKVGVEVLTV